MWCVYTRPLEARHINTFIQATVLTCSLRPCSLAQLFSERLSVSAHMPGCFYWDCCGASVPTSGQNKGMQYHSLSQTVITHGPQRLTLSQFHVCHSSAHTGLRDTKHKAAGDQLKGASMHTHVRVRVHVTATSSKLCVCCHHCCSCTAGTRDDTLAHAGLDTNTAQRFWPVTANKHK